MAEDARARAYYQYFKAQQGGGGEIPVYRASQSGAGFGDIFRSALRFIAPILFRSVQTFTGEASKALDQGASLGEAAKAALMPTVGTALSSALAARAQSGRGKRRRKHARKVYKVVHKATRKTRASRRRKAISPPKKKKRRSHRRRTHKKAKFNF